VEADGLLFGVASDMGFAGAGNHRLGLVALIKPQPHKICLLELSNLNRQILNQIRKSFPIRRGGET
jgi:hypothetical protein